MISPSSPFISLSLEKNWSFTRFSNPSFETISLYDKIGVSISYSYLEDMYDGKILS